jgi:hypothetical protein
MVQIALILRGNFFVHSLPPVDAHWEEVADFSLSINYTWEYKDMDQAQAFGEKTSRERT